jgi:hypothetical protein
MSKPQYKYYYHFGLWRVDKMAYFENGYVGSKVAEYATKEEARKETYRLNGWKQPTTK